MIKSKPTGSKGRQIERRDRIENNKKHRSERSSSYSINHEHAKKNGERDTKTLERPKGHALGGNPNDLLFCLNTGKLEVTGTFSLEKLVTHLLVRGTISF